MVNSTLTRRGRGGRRRTTSIMTVVAVLTAVASSHMLRVHGLTVSPIPTASSTAVSVPDDGVPAVNASLPISTSAISTAAAVTTALPLQAPANGSSLASAASSSVSLSANPDLVSKAVSEATGTATPTSSSKAKGRTSSSTKKGSGGAGGEREQAKTSAATKSTKSEATKAAAAAGWTYAAGAFGCAQGTASGSAYMCHATGAPVRRRGDDAFEHVWDKRQQDNTDDTEDKSGNGGPPADILNKDSPDVGWLDVIVGAVPYKNGDLAASIAWILAVLVLFPLFLVRLFRRSSLIAHVLLFVFIWGCVMLATFGIRAYLSNRTPTTGMMNAQNILLQMLPCFLIEPLLNLLSLYAQQGGFPTGVPRVAVALRFLNLVAFLLYVVGAAYMTVWVNGWDSALQDNQQVADRSAFPGDQPDGITRIGPIVAGFLQIITIIGALLLIPIARGENGSMRPGGFIAFLVLLITIPVVYRVLQTLHAQGELSDESGSQQNPFQILSTARTMSAAVANALVNLVPVYEVAPPGMYSADVSGIDWSQLQQTLASRGRIQSPLVFNLVYVFPQWFMVFLFFFIHAPGHQNNNKLATPAMQP